MDLTCVCGVHCFSEILATTVQAELQVGRHQLGLEHLKSFHILLLSCRRLNSPHDHGFCLGHIFRSYLISLELSHDISLVLKHFVLRHDRDVLSLDALVLHEGSILMSFPIRLTQRLAWLIVLRESIE